LYAKDSQKKPMLYQYAFVPNYATSVMLNKLFRNIKENENIDYIEESDDEDIYEDVRRDKFVDLQRMMLMECVFDRKFRKWTPMREATPNLERYVPYINQLVVMKSPQKSHGSSHNHRSQMRSNGGPHKKNQAYKPHQNKMVR
jgi:hypothetical protein